MKLRPSMQVCSRLPISIPAKENQMENNVETGFVSYSAHAMMKMGLGLYGCVRRTQIHSQVILGCRLGLGLLAVGVFFSLLGP